MSGSNPKQSCSVAASTGARPDGERSSYVRSDSDSTAKEESGSNLVMYGRQAHRPHGDRKAQGSSLSHEINHNLDPAEVQSKSSHQGSYASKESKLHKRSYPMLSFGDEIEEQESTGRKIGESTAARFATENTRAKRHAAAHAMPPAGLPAVRPISSCGGVSIVDDDDANMKSRAGCVPLSRIQVGIHAVMGRRKSMEDRHTFIANLKPIALNGDSIVDGLERSFVGVYDGHNGSQSAEQLQSRLHRLLAAQPSVLRFQDSSRLTSGLEPEDDVARGIKHAFQTMEDEILQRARAEGGRDGSTACVLLRLGTVLYIAHTGDSRAVLCSNRRAQRLSKDHKPDDEVEKQRIQAVGGRVEFGGCWRVICPQMGSGLAVARAFGDINFKEPVKLVESTPDVRRVQLQPSDSFAVLASDGLWDVLDDQQACDIVLKELDGGEDGSAESYPLSYLAGPPDENDSACTRAAKALIQHAIISGSGDNTTAAVVQFCWGEQDRAS